MLHLFSLMSHLSFISSQTNFPIFPWQALLFGICWPASSPCNELFHFSTSQSLFHLSRIDQLKCNNLLKDVSIQFSSVAQSCRTLCDPMNCSTPGLPVITNSRSSLGLTSIESVMPSSHLILCCPLLLLPPIPPSIRVFSNESTLCMRWPKYVHPKTSP